MHECYVNKSFPQMQIKNGSNSITLPNHEYNADAFLIDASEVAYGGRT